MGFFLVFVLSSWTASALAAGACWLLAAHMETWGPAAEKRAAALATLLPIILGGLVSVCVALYSVTPQLFGGADHCQSHGHHLHLCLVHGGGWVDEAWAVAGSAALLALFLVRGARLLSALLAGRRRVDAIEASSRRVTHRGTAVHVAPSEMEFCFAARYLNPQIFVASSLWQRLAPIHRDAIIAHEQAHIHNRDLWKSLLLAFGEILGAPFLGGRARRRWDHATERLCDRTAADQIGDATAVAEALLSWARGPRLLAGISFSPAAETLEARIVAVLSERPSGHMAALHMASLAAMLIVGATGLAGLLVDPLHHLLETFFGLGTQLF